jgi:AraC-like DNA-binding protein
MNPVRLDTRTLPLKHQLEAWRDWFCDVFAVMPLQTEKEGFAASSELWVMDGFAVSRVFAPPLYGTRTKALIRRNPIDHWCLTLGQARTGIKIPTASIVAPAKVPFVVSLGHELVSERKQDNRLQIYLSRDTFSEIGPLLDAIVGAPIETRLGQLLAEYMMLLESWVSKSQPEDLSRLKTAISTMIAACLAPSHERMAIAASQLDLSRLERVRRVVRKHLQSSALGTEFLCREVATSRSQLYRLLEGEGGVSRYIRRQRLLEAYARLCDTSESRPIAALAEDLCFSDASTFGRAFRQEFGESPGEVRAAARAGQLVQASTRDRLGPAVRTLRDCLSAF